MYGSEDSLQPFLRSYEDGELRVASKGSKHYPPTGDPTLQLLLLTSVSCALVAPCILYTSNSNPLYPIHYSNPLYPVS